MKKTLLFFTLFSVIIFNSGAVTTAAVLLENPLGSEGGDIPTLINTIASWLLGVGSTIAVIIILWAALLFMTSGGNVQKVTLARQTLMYAIIGLAILILAKGVAAFVQNILSGSF